jgi:hypothetical protein
MLETADALQLFIQEKCFCVNTSHGFANNKYIQKRVFGKRSRTDMTTMGNVCNSVTQDRTLPLDRYGNSQRRFAATTACLR